MLPLPDGKDAALIFAAETGSFQRFSNFFGKPFERRGNFNGNLISYHSLPLLLEPGRKFIVNISCKNIDKIRSYFAPFVKDLLFGKLKHNYSPFISGSMCPGC